MNATPDTNSSPDRSYRHAKAPTCVLGDNPIPIVVLEQSTPRLPHHKQTKRNEEIDEARNHSAGWKNETREIDFGNDVRIADQTIACFRQRIREELPRQRCSEDEDGVRNTI
jgi:hypothetical protein